MMSQLRNFPTLRPALLTTVILSILSTGPSFAGEEIKAVTAGGVTAHFLGEKVQGVELSFGVERLQFTFQGDRKTYDFKPQGTLHFSDWRFDIFAPDSRHVLLLQDRFGPYHVVGLARLKTCLLGKAKPDHVFGNPKTENPGSVKEDGRWVSAGVIEYVAACCGTREKRQYELPR